MISKNNLCHTFIIILILLFFNSILISKFSDQFGDTKRVVLIGIDGMSTNGFQQAHTPNLDNLIKDGIVSLNSRSVLPTVSSPNWASILTGSGPEQHGVSTNEWKNNSIAIQPVVTDSDGYYPSIFSLLKEQKSKSEVAFFYDWKGLGDFINLNKIDKKVLSKSTLKSVNATLDYLSNSDPNFLFLWLGEVDRTGHKYGWETEKYLEAISEMDSYVGQIVNLYKNKGIIDETYFIITSDHGGTGKGHGNESMSDLLCPLIISGPKTLKNQLVKSPINNIDISPTIAWLFEIEQPKAWVGKPINDAFMNKTTKVDRYIPKPIINPNSGLFMLDNVEITIQSVWPGLEIFFTTDGTTPSRNSIQYNAPFTISKSSFINAIAFDAKQQSEITKGDFRIIDKYSTNGVNFNYYEGNYILLPNFDEQKIVASGKAWEFSIDSIDHRDDHFAIKYWAYIEISIEGEYNFYITSDDGSKLFINGNEVIDNDGSRSVLTRNGSIYLNKGMHAIEVHYFDDYMGEYLKVSYDGPGFEKKVIPTSVLFTKR